MLNNFQLNSGDVRHSRYVDRDRYCAGGAPVVKVEMALGMPVMALELQLHQAT